jgi:hypothetical protein
MMVLDKQIKMKSFVNRKSDIILESPLFFTVVVRYMQTMCL